MRRRPGPHARSGEGRGAPRRGSPGRKEIGAICSLLQMAPSCEGFFALHGPRMSSFLFSCDGTGCPESSDFILLAAGAARSIYARSCLELSCFFKCCRVLIFRNEMLRYHVSHWSIPALSCRFYFCFDRYRRTFTNSSDACMLAFFFALSLVLSQ